MTERSLADVASQARQSLGERLRKGRLNRDMTAAQVAEELRVPQAMVDAMEAGDFERLGATVYARGYLGSYVRWLGLPQADVDAVLERVQSEPLPPLHSARQMSHGRYLMERYARRAVYIVLTASIVVPVVWLATQERLPVDPVALRSLDAVPMPASSDASTQVAGIVKEQMVMGPPEALAGARAASEDGPVVASFTPFLSGRTVSKTEVQREAGWRMVFRGDSWVEILDRNGQRLEFGVIRAGTERQFPSGAVARVALGNAGVVDITHDGEPVSITPFQRANVARFAVSSEDELLPPGS